MILVIALSLEQAVLPRVWTIAERRTVKSLDACSIPPTAFFEATLPSEWNNGRVKLGLWVFLVFALHAAMAVKQGNAPLSGDEPRYWQMAENLTRGGFASPETRLLWNGPGYALTLAPWVALGAPSSLPRLMNAAWMALAALALYAAFKCLGLKHALLHMVLASLYLALHGSLSDRLMSEPLSAACSALALFGYALVVTGKRPRSGAVLLAISLAYLTLTKVIFAYVMAGLVVALAAIAVTVFWRRKRRPVEGASRSTFGYLALALAGAHALCLPYLAYTYHLTGKFYYWGNSGGAQLYCLTLPEPHFLGDWLNSDAVIQDPDFYGPHSRFYAAIDTLDFVTQDGLLKVSAIAHLKAHPAKVFSNWRANVNRMVFGYPVSAYPGHSRALSTGNRAFVHALWFYALVALVTALLTAGWKRPWLWSCLWRNASLRAALTGPLLFTSITLAGLSMLSTEPRLMFAVLPVLYGLLAIGFQALMSMFAPTPGMLGAPAGGKVANNC